MEQVTEALLEAPSNYNVFWETLDGRPISSDRYPRAIWPTRANGSKVWTA